MAKITYPTIPNEALVDIQVSGAFYKDLLGLQISLSETVTLEQYKKVLEELKNDKPPESVFSNTVQIVMAMIYEIEVKAKAQDKIKIIEIDPDENIVPST